METKWGPNCLSVRSTSHWTRVITHNSNLASKKALKIGKAIGVLYVRTTHTMGLLPKKALIHVKILAQKAFIHVGLLPNGHQSPNV